MRKRDLQRWMGWYVSFLVLMILSALIYFGQGFTRDGASTTAVPFSNPIKPSYIYLLTYGVTFSLVTIFVRWLPRPSSGLILSMSLLGLLHLVWMPFVESDPVVMRTLVLRMNVVVMAICFQLIFSMVADYRLILTTVRIVLWATTLLNMLVVTMPHLFSIRMSIFQGRAAGLFDNPNLCATFMAMLLPLAAFGKPLPIRCVHYLVILIGIFFTFSRGGMVIWALAVFLDLVFRPGDSKVKPRSILINVLLAVTFAALLVAVIASAWFDILQILAPNLNSDTMARLGGTDEGSSSDRMIVLAMGLQAFLENPVFGGGYASTRIWDHSVSVHNMFILLLAEFGVIGGLWYMDFLRRLFTFPARFGIVIGTLMTVESVFTHSYFDLAHYMLLVMIYWRLSMLIAERASGVAPPPPERFL